MKYVPNSLPVHAEDLISTGIKCRHGEKDWWTHGLDLRLENAIGLHSWIGELKSILITVHLDII